MTDLQDNSLGQLGNEKIGFLKGLFRPRYSDFSNLQDLSPLIGQDGANAMSGKMQLFERILGSVGQKPESNFQKLMKAIGVGSTGLAAATEDFNAQPQFADYYRQQQNRILAPEQQRQSALGSLVTGQLFPKQKDATNDIQNYEYYVNQMRTAGKEPMTFDRWKAIGGSGGEQMIPGLQELLGLMINRQLNAYKSQSNQQQPFTPVNTGSQSAGGDQFSF